MKIIDVYTKKEYECPICKEKIYYGKIAKENGEFVTKDGQRPNGKFGKENNVLSGAVDIHVKDRLHACTAGKTQEEYQKLIGGGLAELAINSNPKPIQKVVWYDKVDFLTMNTPQQNLVHGYHDLNKVAYHLTKEQHPNMSSEDNVFGQIVHAKSLVLSNLLIAENLKKLREQLEKQSD